MSETKLTAGVLRSKLARVLHEKGVCGHDGGLWEQVEKSGYECECFERIDLLLPHIARLEADSKKLREPATCNAGHKSNLPVALWDCPVCTQLLRDHIEQVKGKVEELLKETRNIVAAFRNCMVINKVAPQGFITIRLKKATEAIRAVEAALGGKVE